MQWRAYHDFGVGMEETTARRGVEFQRRRMSLTFLHGRTGRPGDRRRRLRPDDGTGTNTARWPPATPVYYDTTNGWIQSGTNANTIKFGQVVARRRALRRASSTMLHIPVD
jgi:hypothetical protein